MNAFLTTAAPLIPHVAVRVAIPVCHCLTLAMRGGGKNGCKISAWK